ncbi:hypothetical protein Tco_1428136 [Tanacetum coccineum]
MILMERMIHPIGVASAIQEGVTPSVVDMTVEMDRYAKLFGRYYCSGIFSTIIYASYYKGCYVHELRFDVELKDNIVVAMPRIKEEGYCTCNIHNIGADATKNLKKTSQTPKGISVGQKMGFKSKQVFQPVSKNSTANTGGKKRNKSESTKEVSKSTPFEVLTSMIIECGSMGTNGGNSNSADKGN